MCNGNWYVEYYVIEVSYTTKCEFTEDCNIKVLAYNNFIPAAEIKRDKNRKQYIFKT